MGGKNKGKYMVKDGKVKGKFQSTIYWEQEAMRYAQGMDFYRGLLRQIGETLGVDAYMADDGSVMEDPLALKIPELVRELIGKNRRAFRQNRALNASNKELREGLEILFAIHTQWIMAFGALATLSPTLKVDVTDPLGMASEIAKYVHERTEKMETKE